MKRHTLLALALFQGAAWAESSGTNAPPAAAESKAASLSARNAAKKNVTAAQLQTALDQLTQSNRDLLDLLKQQQAVLEDIQYDRRLQSRQIQSLEERLGQSQMENAGLQRKVDSLEAAAELPASATATTPTVPPAAGGTSVVASPTNAPASEETSANPEPPATNVAPQTFLPPAPEAPEVTGEKAWHRLLTLKGEDGQNSDLFRIQGHTWRVLWHNADKEGKAYANTSALFVNAFPRDDTVPQKVCAKLGTGGDTTELQGPGNYYLKIEASGGSWEAAVEDYH